MDTLDTFFNNTTSQFYVVLTGTSTFLSGLMMFLEWLHYTYFGISIVDRLAALVIHVFPFLNSSKNKDASAKAKKVAEAKPFRNSLMLFHGAEYNRYYIETGKGAVTDYDVFLTSMDFQAFFTFEGLLPDNDLADAFMQTVWREYKGFVLIFVSNCCKA